MYHDTPTLGPQLDPPGGGWTIARIVLGIALGVGAFYGLWWFFAWAGKAV